MNENVETLVIGAGISGLVYAHRRASEDCVVLEAGDSAGGKVHTGSVRNPIRARFETGPETISDATGEAEALALELGLELQRAPESAGKRFLVLGGRLRELPLSGPKLLTSSLLSLPGRLRLMSEPLRSRSRGLDGSMAEFVRHRLGDEVLQLLVDPMLAGIHAAAPEELSLRACFPDLACGVEEHGSLFGYMRARRAGREKEPGPKRDSSPWKPAGGMQRLTDALARKLGTRLRLGMAAQSLKSTRAGWEVQTAAGVLCAQRIVLALPVRAAQRLLVQPLPRAAQLMSEIRTEGLIVNVHAYRRCDVEHPLDGFGYLVPSREGLRHLGTLFPSSVDHPCVEEGFVLLRTMLGGSRRPEMQRATDEEFASILREEVQPLLGIRGEPVFAALLRHPESLPRFDLRHIERRDALEESLPGELSLLGNYMYGIGISSLIARSRRLAEEHALEPAGGV